MRTEPAVTDGRYTPTRHLNMKISKKDWCSKYRPGSLYCMVEQNLYTDLCLYCKFRKPLDIPGMLIDHDKENR
ncbi:MAG: hypothetical protein ACTSX1_15160 [Candidatus Heimdallarchaeaceae archaeon]